VVLVWSETWNAKGEKGKEYFFLKHTPIQAIVPQAAGGETGIHPGAKMGSKLSGRKRHCVFRAFGNSRRVPTWTSKSELVSRHQHLIERWKVITRKSGSIPDLLELAPKPATGAFASYLLVQQAIHTSKPKSNRSALTSFLLMLFNG
jgi:hypothetical protein